MVRFLVLTGCLIVAGLVCHPSYAANIFNDDEQAVILSFGPWPPPLTPDPGNRVSGNPQAITFGKDLFRDRRLSKDGVLSCADCHQPENLFADGIALNRGHGRIDRHTPSVLNLRWNNWFGWGGEADSLWAQSIRPILSPNEMAATPDLIRNLVRNDPNLTRQFGAVFDASPKTLADEEIVVMVGKALAAFQETLVSPKTPFDLFRDAVEVGDRQQMQAYPIAAKRGLKIFIGEGRCFFCHFGPRLTNGEFADIGISSFIRRGKVDKGRYGGIKALKKSRFNLLGKYNDAPDGDHDIRTRHVRVQHRNWGEFKVPSLRNVARSAPYMHNGSINKLSEVIDFYSNLNEERLHTEGEKILQPLDLTDGEKTDLLIFLTTLSVPDSDH
jgi:cytochrome c peroxidase